jgi:nucleotide-binding universal stress UspA family protein
MYKTILVPIDMAHVVEGKANVDLAASHCAQGSKVILLNMDVDVRVGHSYDTILKVAKERNVDLIIIASHRPGFQDYFLGSTAAKVVRHANCSVLVVR